MVNFWLSAFMYRPIVTLCVPLGEYTRTTSWVGHPWSRYFYHNSYDLYLRVLTLFSLFSIPSKLQRVLKSLIMAQCQENQLLCERYGYYLLIAYVACTFDMIMAKVKVSPLRAMKALGTCGCKGPHILSHDTRKRSYARPSFPVGKPLIGPTHLQEAEWTPGPVWTRRSEEKSSPRQHPGSNPGHSARSPSTLPFELPGPLRYNYISYKFILN